MLYYQPFEEVKIFRLEVMNELTNIILLYHLFFFTDFVGDAEVRYQIGWSFIAVTAGNMFVHFTLMVINMVCDLKEKIQNKCCPKPEPPEEEKPEVKVEVIKPDLTIVEEEVEEFEAESNFSRKS